MCKEIIITTLTRKSTKKIRITNTLQIVTHGSALYLICIFVEYSYVCMCFKHMQTIQCFTQIKVNDLYDWNIK